MKGILAPRYKDKSVLYTLFFCGLCTGCQSLKQSSKYAFGEGYYQSRFFHPKDKRVYVVPLEDSIRVYRVEKEQIHFKINTASVVHLSFSAMEGPLQQKNHRFRKSTLDLDLLTVLAKFRPSVKGFPPQLNTTFSAAPYMGWRSDVYHVRYQKTPFGVQKRSINHYGYSFGIFSGLGTARIDEYVTNNLVAIQYDGVVNLSGIAAILAVNNVSVGVNLGVDFLLDKNRNHWVNNKKPWVGVSVGLNLN